MARKAKPDFKDDNRTIVNMNVEGMPWYAKKPDYMKNDNSSGGVAELSFRERLHFIGGATLAAFLVWFVFAAGFAILIGIMLLIFKLNGN